MALVKQEPQETRLALKLPRSLVISGALFWVKSAGGACSGTSGPEFGIKAFLPPLKVCSPLRRQLDGPSGVSLACSEASCVPLSTWWLSADLLVVPQAPRSYRCSGFSHIGVLPPRNRLLRLCDVPMPWAWVLPCRPHSGPGELQGAV
ncbi:hypothetical protein VULLAG_LOCUS5413 [Vulpes lagopus]